MKLLKNNLTISNNQYRQDLLKQGLWLEFISIAWNLAEAVIAVVLGSNAGSTALIGFGFDSLIETLSAIIVGWRLQIEANGGSLESMEKAEIMASKIAGYLLFTLAAYVLVDSMQRLLGYGKHANESFTGIIITIAALVVMPFLAKAKLKLAHELNSTALKADAIESSCCAWFAFATLAGLVLNATLHWWWADPVASLVLVSLMVKEGLVAVKNKNCSCHNTCS